MRAKTFFRKDCRLCGSELLELKIPLRPIPLSEQFSDNRQSSINAERYSIDVYQCLECLHIQQCETIDPEDLWASYSYFSGKTPNMRQHFSDEFVEIDAKYGNIIGTKNIVEIGSNDGSFLKLFQDGGYSVLGIDPAENPCKKANTDNIPTINSLYAECLNQEIKQSHFSKASVVLAYNVFAHMDNVKSILAGISDLLDTTAPSIFRFEVQYAKSLIEGDLVASIFHEHVNHYSLIPLSRFLALENLYIVDAKVLDSIQHGSLVVTASHNRNRDALPQTDRLRYLLREECMTEAVFPRGLEAFKHRLGKRTSVIREELERIQQLGYSICGYGAARSASTILTQLNIRDYFDVVYDEDQAKHGKFISGEGLRIEDPTKLDKGQLVCLVILAWSHSRYLLTKLDSHIRHGGLVITLFPELCVHSKNAEEFLSFDV